MTSTLPESSPDIYSHAGPNWGVLKRVSESVYQAMCDFEPTTKNEDGTFRLANPRWDGVSTPDFPSTLPSADQYAS